MTYDTGGNYPPPSGQHWGNGNGIPVGGPGHPQQPPNTPRRKSPWLWILGIGAVIVVVVAIAVVVITTASDRDGDVDTAASTVVTYEVTGSTGTVELAYWGPTGVIPPETVTLPWHKDVTVQDEDAFVSVSAQTADGSDRELACKIVVNGNSFVEHRSTSGFVTCDGRLNDN